MMDIDNFDKPMQIVNDKAQENKEDVVFDLDDLDDDNMFAKPAI